MKKIRHLKYFGIAILFISTSCENKKKTQVVIPEISMSAYFDQKPPSDSPEIFAKGIISTIYHGHSSPVYTPDGKELFYTLSHEGGHRLMYMKFENGSWTAPVIAPFSGNYSDDNAHISFDGKRLYFKSRRPINGLSEEENTLLPWVYRNWYVDKIDEKWSANAILNDGGDLGQTYSKTKYLDILADESDPYSVGIYYQKFVNGAYEEPIRMDNDINEGELKYFGYVAPDESYIMFYVFGRADLPENTMGLFISYRDADGKWSKAINLGSNINYPGSSTRFPKLSPDGKYLFFNWQKPRNEVGHQLTEIEASLKPNKPHIGDGDIYWVDASIIQSLNPTN